MSKEVCVVGAGLFGCMAAVKLADAGYRVDLLERDNGIMLGASKNNHNRIHMGYHYLRSIQTARDSIQGLSSFTEAFRDALRPELPNYYAIAAEHSKTSPERFEEFCQIVRIRYRREFPPAQLLDPKRLAACYCVPEPVFDYFSVRTTMLKLLSESTVNVHLRTSPLKVDRKNDRFHVVTSQFSQPYDYMINATYCSLNQVNSMVGAAQRTYRYEDCVIPVFRYDYAPFGLTVMDGEFCSVMPRGFRAGEFLLYHVKHSVLRAKLGVENYDTLLEWTDDAPLFRASAEFMPFLQNCSSFERYRAIRITWENDDDARRSVIYDDIPNYWSVLSGKVTTCVDVADELVRTIGSAH